MEKIAGVLDVSPLVIMKNDHTVVNFNEGANNQGTVRSWINAETVINYQKELVDVIVAARDAEIPTLKNALDIQQKLLQQQSGIIEKLIGGK